MSGGGPALTFVSGPAVVSFDLDETLWEFLPMMDGALRATLAALELEEPQLRGRITIEELHRVRAEVAARETGTFEELRRESFRVVLARHGVRREGLPEWLVQVWMDSRLTSVAPHPDVEPAFAELIDAGYMLGAITNGNFPVSRLALAEPFAFIVHAEHTGGFKPDAEPFLHAVEMSGGDPARWVHVGDDLVTDVQGAQAMGMRAVWVNRRGFELPPDVTPDAEMTSLEGLLAVVENLLSE